MTNSARAKDAIHRGRVRLMSSHPFYGYLCCGLKLREDADQPTMATDGIHLYYNPDFTVGLTKPQLVAALAHETEHVYLKHMLRGQYVCTCKKEEMPGENMHKMDCPIMIMMIAADMAINPHLKDAGFELIDGAVFPEKEFWRDAMEDHYKRIKKQCQSQSGKGQGKGQGMGGSCSGVRKAKGANGKDMTPGEIQRMEADIQTAIMQAASFARAAGNLPAEFAALIDELRKPKVAWFDVLRRFMQSTAKNDYRMLPPNRRYVHMGQYLPSLRSEAVGDVLLILDGSGSTWNVFPQFISEFISVYTDVQPEHLHIMVWDTHCGFYKDFTNFDDECAQSLLAYSEKMTRGGGTVFTECFDWFEQEVGIHPQIAVVLTDMELFGDWPEQPNFPVMWVATTDIVGPYGETVKIEAE